MTIVRPTLWVFVLFLLTTCGSDSSSGKQAFEGISAAEASGNSAIVRNPVRADGTIDTVNVAKLAFTQTTYDFGVIEQGEVISHEYTFRNTGTVPLLITDARSTCGCTVPDWPRQPIEPGQTGRLTVRFDSENKSGRQNKPVSITANTYPAITDIYLTGMVQPPGSVQ